MPRPTEPPAREAPLDPARTAVLIVDVQKGIWHPGVAETRPWFHERARDIAIPNMRRLIEAARLAGAEVVYTVIESLTLDGRDRSLDYKQTGHHFPRGSREAEPLDEIAPEGDEIVLPKSSSSVFNSTVLDYVLRNIGLDTVVVAGFLTDQCVDHAVRDGADRGFRMVTAVDACATDSAERHDWALRLSRGYGRQATTVALVAELDAARGG